MKAVSVERWSPQNEARAREFLEERYAASMFLLGNLAENGPILGENPNSGNFQVVLEADQVVGVFCLARRGNLLMTLEPRPDVLEATLDTCTAEPLELKGVIGGWDCVSAFWDLLNERGIVRSCSFRSREILYRLDPLAQFASTPEVRFLCEHDFSQWYVFRAAFNAEEGLKHALTEEQMRRNFLRQCSAKGHWGYFEGDRLVSMASVNSRALDIGQVGGVYTPRELRGKGYSQATMRQMLKDCAHVHGFKKMILFTGEKNFAAQRVYEKLGFERIGHFGVFFV